MSKRLACCFFFLFLPLLVNAADTARWEQLNPKQQQALATLQPRWNSLAPNAQKKWLEVAERYQKMSPAEQQRVQERIQDWMALTPEQRRQARENFREAKQVPTQKRQEKWQQYQQLPDDEKRRLGQTQSTEKVRSAAAPQSANMLSASPAPPPKISP